jgi:hypothetical protein
VSVRAVRFSDSRAGSTWLSNRAEAGVFYNVPDSLIFRANTQQHATAPGVWSLLKKLLVFDRQGTVGRGRDAPRRPRASA